MTNTTHRGHGGRNSFDQGAVGNGTTEYKEVSWVNDRMLAVTKWRDTSDFSATTVNGNLVNIANNVNRVAKSSDTNVSNHQNAFNRKATGVEVWYYLGDSKGRQLAERLSAAIANALGLSNRGAKATTDLYVVSQTVGTTVLIEWCFVDNANDMSKWRANKHKAVDAALNVLGYKTGGGTTVVKPKVKNTYWSNGSYFEALQDLRTYDKNFKKVDNTVFLKKGSKFPVRNIQVSSSGTTHAFVAGLSNTCVTLAKSHVKKL